MMCISCLPIRMSFVGLYSVLLSGTVFADFTYYVPQVVDGRVIEEVDEVFKTVFNIINPSDQEITVTLSLTGDNGEPYSRLCTPRPFGGFVFCDASQDYTIPPFAEVSVGTAADAPQSPLPFAAKIGWAKLEAPREVGFVVTLYHKQLYGEILTATALPAAPLLDDFSFPVRNKCGGVSQTASTGIALLNPSSTEEAQVVFSLYKQGEFFDERTIGLKSLGKVALFLDQDGLFTELGCFRGTVRISSSAPLSSGVILVDGDHWICVPVFSVAVSE